MLAACLEPRLAGEAGLVQSHDEVVGQAGGGGGGHGLAGEAGLARLVPDPALRPGWLILHSGRAGLCAVLLAGRSSAPCAAPAQRPAAPCAARPA